MRLLVSRLEGNAGHGFAAAMLHLHVAPTSLGSTTCGTLDWHAAHQVRERLCACLQAGSWKVGDMAVPLQPGMGTWRQQACFPLQGLWRVPAGISAADAATMHIK